jgi:demethoxyubiquinone hydroxylase (CLK1/Coq7/Cat5 family)
MAFEEATCGQELAQDAEVPELLGELWEHVATNMVAHAKWVGTATREAATEHDCLLHVAREYRNIAAAAERAAAIMRSMADQPPAPHDPARADRPAQARFIRRKIELQLELADLLIRHAETSRSALGELELQPDDS